MRIKFSQDNNDLTIFLIGELDEHYAKGARDYIDTLCDEKNPKTVIFDLSELTFMDSTGIGILLGRYKKLKKIGTDCYLTNPISSVEKVIQLSGIYEIMPKL